MNAGTGVTDLRSGVRLFLKSITLTESNLGTHLYLILGPVKRLPERYDWFIDTKQVKDVLEDQTKELYELIDLNGNLELETNKVTSVLGCYVHICVYM